VGLEAFELALLRRPQNDRLGQVRARLVAHERGDIVTSPGGSATASRGHGQRDAGVARCSWLRCLLLAAMLT
jgi:hypothetical protein